MRLVVLSAMLCLQILSGTYVFSRLFPTRPRYPVRLLLCSATLFSATFLLLISTQAYAASHVGLSGILVSALGRIAILTLLTAMVVVCRDTNLWRALFCSTCGYTMRGLTYGLATIAIDILWGPYAQVRLRWIVALLALGTLVVYPVCNRLMARSIEEHGVVAIPAIPMLLMTGMVIVVEVVFELVIADLSRYAIPVSRDLILRLVHASASAFMLFMEYELLYRRRLERDVATIGRIRADGARQYELSRENIDALNMKFHDIRHQIRHLGDEQDEGLVDRELLDDIAREVRVYDSTVKTGNEALDVLLTEKRLACGHEGITLSCIADGSALDFMSPTDLYALLGNALDNAISAVRLVDDPEKRTLSVSVRRGMGLVSIHMENYFVHRQHPSDAEYAIGAIKAVVGHYGGTMTMRDEGEVFHLNVVLPVHS